MKNFEKLNSLLTQFKELYPFSIINYSFTRVKEVRKHVVFVRVRKMAF